MKAPLSLLGMIQLLLLLMVLKNWARVHQTSPWRRRVTKQRLRERDRMTKQRWPLLMATTRRMKICKKKMRKTIWQRRMKPVRREGGWTRQRTTRGHRTGCFSSSSGGQQGGGWHKGWDKWNRRPGGGGNRWRWRCCCHANCKEDCEWGSKGRCCEDDGGDSGRWWASRDWRKYCFAVNYKHSVQYSCKYERIVNVLYGDSLNITCKWRLLHTHGT